MEIKRLNLKDYYPFLGEGDANPYVDAYLQPDVMRRKDFKRPCLIICPGGGYGFCSDREAEPIALNFLPEGFNIFILYYTCRIKKYPTQLLETAALMELIYKNAEEWQCDTDKISIMGFSAGGHLACHYSTSFDCAEVRKVFPQSKGPNGAVLCYPVITAKEGKCHPGSFVNLVGHHPLTEDEEKIFSLENCVTDRTPPTFIWHTTEDTAVPVYGSIAYAKALSEHNVPFELHIFPKGWHGIATSDSQTMETDGGFCRYNHIWLEEFKKWFEFMGLK